MVWTQAQEPFDSDHRLFGALALRCSLLRDVSAQPDDGNPVLLVAELCLAREFVETNSVMHGRLRFAHPSRTCLAPESSQGGSVHPHPYIRAALA